MPRFLHLIILLFVLYETHAQNEQFVPALGGGSCCCGPFVELYFPNLDFDEAPFPPPGGLITYYLGESFSGWTVTRENIDHKDAYFGNLTLGNPNGRTNFVDLHGSPGFGAIEYNLTGLTSGNTYRIEFWTAQNGSGYTSTGTLKIAGGAWLTGSWTVDTDGSIFWFKVTFMFTAKGSSAKMEFSSTGGNVWGGTLIDDIKIFECPGDVEEPQVNNPPEDVNVECDSEIPPVPVLSVVDNCDLNPVTTFKQTTDQIDPCTKLITRNWEVKDACGNIHKEDQLIKVEDKSPPDFTTLPKNKTVSCADDVKRLFGDWIKNNGYADAADACGKVSWRNNIEHQPSKSCDTSLVEFIAVNHCGLETSEFATFYVIDTIAPSIYKKAENRSFSCNPSAIDSLRNWLSSHAYADAKDACDTTIWWNNFDGDSTKKDIKVSFYVKDRCGNTDSTLAHFINRSSSDTFRISNTSCTIKQDQSDTMVYTLNGCDSIVIVNTTKVFSSLTQLKVNTCDPLNKMFDTLFLINMNGCDSLVITEFVLQTKHQTIINDSSCQVQKFSQDTLILSGQYCDSLVITIHFPLQHDSVTVHQFSCDSSQKGTVTLQLLNHFHCDSIVNVITDYSQNTITQLTSNECGLIKSYTDTMIYSTSHCDSLVITFHNALHTDSIALIKHTCDPQMSGTFKQKLINQSGCDSIVLIQSILDPTDSSYQMIFSCDAAAIGLKRNLFQNRFGCDSIQLIETFLKPADTTQIQKSSCLLSQTGIHAKLFTNQSGCDSLVVTNTIFIPSDTSYVKLSTCQLSMQGTDTLLYTTSTCDSLVIQTTQFIPSDTFSIQKTSCFLSNAGRDTLFYKNTGGCDSVIYSETKYVPIKLQYQLDSISCFGKDDGVITILNGSDFSMPYEFILNNQNPVVDSVINHLQAGSYSLFVKDHSGCVTDTIYINLFNPGELITDLGPDLDVKQGSKVNLVLNSNKALQIINWFPSQLTSCTNCALLEFHADQDTWIYTLALDDRNCESRDSIFIHVKKSGSVYAPNVFSPNGDNINDYFSLIGDESILIELFQVFDRWGELLFETKNIHPNKPELGWNGSYKSEKMNPGVYVYYAKVKMQDGTEQQIKGDFTLVR